MDKADKKADILNVVADLTREISITDSLEKMINTFTTRFSEVFPFKHTIIWLVSDELNILTQAYSTIPGDKTIPLDEDNIVVSAIKENRTIYVPDFSVEKRFTPFMHGCLSGIVIPLHSFGKTRGAIHIESHTREYFSENTILYLNVLANQLAVSLRNYHLFNQINSLKNYLDTLIEKVNAIMFVMDSVGRIKRVNEAAEKYTEYKKEELYGTLGINLVTSPERKRSLMSLVPKIRRGEFISGIEMEITTKSGGRKFCLFNFGGILESEGRLKEIIAIGQDITKTKETEMKLMQAEKLALIGQIASSIIHEINNPLALVSSYAEVLCMKAESDGRTDDVNKLKIILESTDRLTKLAQNLMSFVRTTGTELTRINLNQAIEEAIKWVEPMLRKGNIHIVKDFGKDLPDVKGNKTEIQQVFLNLMSNAIHAMEKKIGNIKITTEYANNGYVAMIITDEGVGIKQQDLKKIFEPFFTTKPTGRGTGLGLSIVQRIVERHNGRIAVKSKVGAGTSVKILLPLAEGGGKR
jgi:PAS domain S-box-containing protein